jgi:hypothetical protein
VRSPLDCPPPGGEPLPEVCGRVLRAIGQIGASHENGDDVLVVAHGGVISVYLCHLLGVSFNSLWRMRIDNCSLTIARPPRLVSVNDTSHLPNTPNSAWFEVSGSASGSPGAAAGGAGGRGRRDPFPPSGGGPKAPGWSPAAEEQRTRAAWSSSRPLPPAPPAAAPGESEP